MTKTFYADRIIYHLKFDRRELNVMFYRVLHDKLKFDGTRKLRLKLLSATIAFSSFLPYSLVYAAEGTIEENSGKSNESILNWLESEDYIFTAERIPTNRWDTPANVYVITAEEIEKNNWQSVEEALSHINGVVITRMFGSKPSIMLNGSWNVATLIDGQRLDNDDYMNNRSANPLIIPSIKMIERIEIVKGGYSALYGSDAVGGVINIITKKGTRDETVVDVNFGSWKRRNYEIVNQGVKGKFSWFATTGLHRSAPYEYKGGSENLSDGDDNTFFLRFDNRFDDKSSLTLKVMHRSHDFGNYGSSDDVNEYRFDLYNNISMTYNFKEGTSTPGFFRYFNNYKANNFTYDNWIKHGEWVNDEMIYHDELSHNDVSYFTRMQGLDYQNGWELGKHKIITGLEWHQNKVKTYETKLFMDLFDELSYPNPQIHNRAYYLQDTISFNKKWTLVVGTRFDRNSEFGHHWSPKIALNYRPQEKTKLYAWWGRTYRAPTWNQLRNTFYGNPKLKPETGSTVSFGVEHNFDSYTSLTMNFFDTKLKHLIGWDDSWSLLNSNEIDKQRGIEISLGHRVNDHLNFNVGYSHIKATKYDDWHYPQPNGLRVGIYYQNRGLKANLLSIMGSGFDDNFEEQQLGAERFATFDFNVIYDLNEYITLYSRAVNFTNQKYPLGGDTHSYGAGRFFQIGATCRF